MMAEGSGGRMRVGGEGADELMQGERYRWRARSVCILVVNGANGGPLLWPIRRVVRRARAMAHANR